MHQEDAAFVPRAVEVFIDRPEAFWSNHSRDTSEGGYKSYYMINQIFNRKKDIAYGLTAPFFMLGLNEAYLLIKMEGLRPNYKLD